MTLATELDKIDAATAAIRSLQPPAPPPSGALPAVFTSPVPNRVFQQSSAGTAEVRCSWRGTANSARLKQGSTLISESTVGNFGLIAAGWYDLVLVTNGVEGDRIKVGVGNVYITAGQSNSVSPVQPHDFTMPVPAEGKVILSDYYRFGHHIFKDPAVDPLVVNAGAGVYQAGAGWLYAGIAMNRSYPVMFVNVAQGNTTTAQWVGSLVARVFDAVAIYKPRAILWHQGESDAAASMTQAESFSNMNGCIGSLREVSTTPWIVAKNSTNGGYAPIRAAQQQIIDTWAHVHPGPDTDSLRQASGPEVEFLAVSPVGNQLQGFGSAWATAITANGY